MTITLSDLVAGDRIGAGALIYGSTDAAGAVYVTAALSDFIGGRGGCNASIGVQAGGTFAFQLGWTDPSVTPTADPFAYGTDKGLADGDGCQLQVIVWGAFGAFLEAQTFTGFLWDPHSFVSDLFGKIAHLAVPTAKLDEILAYVQGGSIKSPLIGVTFPVGVAGSPFNGGTTYDLTPPIGIVVGMTWEMSGSPPHIGGELGVITEGLRRSIQIVAFYSLLGGATFAGQTFDSHAVTGTCWFDSPVPTSVSIYVAPGYSASLSWLVT